MSLVWALVIFGSFYNLANYPTLWWDEAIFSETAANLVQKGRYAFTIQSPDEIKDFDFRISAGPTVILPVALAYWTLGVSVWSGRLVAGFFLVLALVLLYLSARLLLDRGAALLGVLLGFGSTDILYWGRSVMGDVPALACFLGGVYLLLRGVQEKRGAFIGAAGLCLGLAVAAKEFYGFTILPAVAVLGWEYRRRWPEFLQAAALLGAGVGLPWVIYIGYKALVLGGVQAALYHFYHQKKLLCHEFFTPCTIGRLYFESAAFLLTNPIFLASLGGLWLYQRREGRSLPWCYWLVNFALWTLFYVLAIYWQRFALPALLLASPWAGYLLTATAASLSRAAGLQSPAFWSRVAVTGVLLAALFPFTAGGELESLLKRSTDSPYKLVDYLRDRIPNHFLIETPEYELTFLDDNHRYHLMPEYYFVEACGDQVVLANPGGRPYDFTQVQADLLILGSFGKSVFKQNYPVEKIQKYYRKIATIDYYDIYLRRDRVLGRQAKTLDSSAYAVD